jgi:hypothetical protein
VDAQHNIGPFTFDSVNEYISLDRESGLDALLQKMFLKAVEFVER